MVYELFDFEIFIVAKSNHICDFAIVISFAMGRGDDKVFTDQRAATVKNYFASTVPTDSRHMWIFVKSFDWFHICHYLSPPWIITFEAIRTVMTDSK